MGIKKEAQSELFKTDVTWFHIFKEIIRNKTWARLSSNSKSLYPVIKAHINWESGSAFPSLDTLQEYSGLSRPSITKALKELEKEGLLLKQSKGRNSSYTVVEKFSVKDGEGRPAASVSFDYLPAYIGDAVTELKNFVAQGLTLPDGKTNFIKIDNLVLNIAHGGGNAINVHAPIDSRLMLKGIKDMLDKKDTEEARMIDSLINLKAAEQ
jgi:biotin operon repressor